MRHAWLAILSSMASACGGSSATPDAGIDAAADMALPAAIDASVLDAAHEPFAMWSKGLGESFILSQSLDGNSRLAALLGTLAETLFAGGVAVDAMGNVYVAGGFQDTIDLGGGPLVSQGLMDIFLAKFDATGRHLWSKRYGDEEIDDAGLTPANQFASAIAVDPAGNLYLTGSFSHHLKFDTCPSLLTTEPPFMVMHGFLAKFDASTGKCKTVISLGGSEALDIIVPGAVAADQASVYLAGGFLGDLAFSDQLAFVSAYDPSTNVGDAFLARFSTTLVVQWAMASTEPAPARPPCTQVATALALDSAGNVYMAGDFDCGIGLGCDGGPLIGNVSQGYLPGDVFLAKFASDGTCLWNESFGDDKIQLANGLAVGSTSLVMVGSYQGTMSFGTTEVTMPATPDGDTPDPANGFVAAFDFAGGDVWSKGFGDDQVQRVRGAAFDPAGNLLLTGDFAGALGLGDAEQSDLTAGDDERVFVAKLDGAGDAKWCFGFGESGRHLARAVAGDAWGRVIAAGLFDGAIDFGGGSLVPSGQNADAGVPTFTYFLAKFRSAP